MIYLLRHGQTEHNLEGRVQGRCDSPLTELGRAQAQAMGKRLREMLDEGGFRVISSPLPRAVATAEIVCEAAGFAGPVSTDERLQEVGCGSWERRRFVTLAGRDPLVAGAPCFLAAWANHCSDGETFDEAVARLSGWLGWAKGHKLVVIGHGVAGSLLRAVYLGLDRASTLRLHSTRQDRFHRLNQGEIEEILC